MTLPTIKRRRARDHVSVEAKVPFVLAQRISEREARFWCRFCDQFHYHGAEDGPRAAHCRTTNSPYLDTGYRLIITDSAQEIPPREERRRPIKQPALGVGILYFHTWEE